MAVQENNTQAELLTVERPFRCAPGTCKCCCYQEASFTSGGDYIGRIEEQFYCWYVIGVVGPFLLDSQPCEESYLTVFLFCFAAFLSS